MSYPLSNHVKTFSMGWGWSYTLNWCQFHYNDVIMGTMASQITSLMIVHSIVYSGTDERKHQSFASLAFVRGIHRSPVNSPHIGPVTRKMFLLGDVIMLRNNLSLRRSNVAEFNVFESSLTALIRILWISHSLTHSLLCYSSSTVALLTCTYIHGIILNLWWDHLFIMINHRLHHFFWLDCT